jgi:hypothetical protein
MGALGELIERMQPAHALDVVSRTRGQVFPRGTSLIAYSVRHKGSSAGIGLVESVPSLMVWGSRRTSIRGRVRSLRWTGVVVVVVAALAVLSARAAIGAERGAGARCQPQWRVFARKVPSLDAVAAVSRHEIWAVGGGAGQQSRPVVVHWDGLALQTTRLPWHSATLSGVAARSASDVWTVGSVKVVAGARRWWFRPLLVHWDGRIWHRINPAVLTADDSLNTVAESPSGDVWIAGESRQDHPFLLHRHGSVWRRVRPGPAGYGHGDLSSVAVSASNDLWAFGELGPHGAGNGYTSLLVHWDGQHWSRSLRYDFYKEPVSGTVALTASGAAWVALTWTRRRVDTRRSRF